MRKAVGIVLAGGRGEDLSVLTERRPKSAVVFGGTFRAIDFVLTNLTRAGVDHIGILSQYRSLPLMEHVDTGMAWGLVGVGRGVRFLPPYLSPTISEWYRGPADALYQNIDFIEHSQADDVLTVSGDHVYSMDYRPMLSFHHEHDADLTIGFVPVEGDASRFGVGELNAAGQIMNLAEKPKHPRTNLASMSVYLLRREVLIEELLQAVKGEGDNVSFQIHEVVRRMISRRRAYGWVHHGGWFYSRTLDEYYAFHGELLGASPKVDLEKWRVLSNTMARTAPPPPTRCLPGAQVDNSLVSLGCVIEGTVRNSVLSPCVHVAKGAVITDSVIWDDVIVEEGAVLSRVISDKRAVFGRGAQVGVGESVPSEEMPDSLTCGATVVGMDVHVPVEARVGRGCIIHPDAGETDLAAPVASGRSIWPTASRSGARP